MAAAIIGLAKDTAKGFGILALCLSLFSFLFYVQ
jgi:hypothetical protein